MFFLTFLFFHSDLNFFLRKFFLSYFYLFHILFYLVSCQS
nr:MAG TPA: hypothetical protein [Caudoviricetes sp.]